MPRLQRDEVDFTDMFSRLGRWIRIRGNAWVTATVRR